MIYCKQLNKEFETKEEMFKAIYADLPNIMKSKQKVQFSCNKSASVIVRTLNSLKLSEEVKASFQMDDNFYYVVVNTTYILDSHDDLHIDGIWDESVMQDQGQNYLLADHYYSMMNTLVKKEHIEMMLVKLPFAALGQSYPGNTQALVYKFAKDKVISQFAKDWLESGDEIQASVRMQYEELEFALDSNDPDYKKEKANYDKYISKIANKADFDYIYYFFIIKKAANRLESSLVLKGSNHVTGNLLSDGEQKEFQEKENKVDPTTVSQKLTSSLLLI